MTIAMPDSVSVNLLPAGYSAYLGYADGDFPTAVPLQGLFPGAQLVILTVTGSTLDADGADVEAGDLNPAGGAAWAARKLAASPGSRPVLYASVLTMPLVTGALDKLMISRQQVRLLSAHYGDGPHICGPASCKLISAPVDGTQWTNAFTMPSGLIDMSMLAGDFFGPVTETEKLVTELGTVREGMTGPAVKTVQALCNARLITIELSIDGVFGAATLSAVKRVQQLGQVAQDGIVGPQTWPVLLGVA